jgi:hypothetical protein
MRGKLTFNPTICSDVLYMIKRRAKEAACSTPGAAFLRPAYAATVAIVFSAPPHCHSDHALSSLEFAGAAAPYPSRVRLLMRATDGALYRRRAPRGKFSPGVRNAALRLPECISR